MDGFAAYLKEQGHDVHIDVYGVDPQFIQQQNALIQSSASTPYRDQAGQLEAFIVEDMTQGQIMENIRAYFDQLQASPMMSHQEMYFAQTKEKVRYAVSIHEQDSNYRIFEVITGRKLPI